MLVLHYTPEVVGPFCHRFLIILSPSFVSHTLRSLVDPHTATRFFSWASTQPRYSHSLDCHVSLITLLLSSPPPTPTPPPSITPSPVTAQPASPSPSLPPIPSSRPSPPTPESANFSGCGAP
ncbi:hypothetical protein RJT34_26037 [Clitoria ternatea]|uniref:Uncharacterized protein n=1 Tax=Clitoria ternatea TaxID=43366 RepID=A0AAN9F8E6_CLITE